MKKIILFLLAASMLCAFGSGCGERKEDGTEGEITLKWVMPGPGKQADSDEVWKQFNDKLKAYDGLSNVNVEIEVIPSSDYSQKFLLMQTGSEALDIVQTYTLDYAKEARNGSFAPMKELLEKEAPDIKKELPEFIIDYGIVDDEIYQIPNYQMLPGLFTLRVNKELADKYMDINDLRESMSKFDNSANTISIIEEFLKKAQAGGELGKGINPGYISLLASTSYDDISGAGYGYKKTDKDHNIVSIIKTDEMKHVYDKMHEFFQQGFIRKDILSAPDIQNENGRKDGQIIYIQNKYSGEDIDITANGDEVYVIYLDPCPWIGTNYAAGGLAISSKSENPEAAMRIIDLMNTEKGKDLYNLLVWGIEGKNYTKTGEDRIETIGYKGQGNSSAPYGLWKWVVGNTKNAYNTQVDKDNYKDFVFKELNEGENTQTSDLIGFRPDISNIEVKLSQYSACVKEFHNPLMFGALGNYDEVYNEFMSKIDACGNDEIIADLQKQVDEYIKNNK